MSTAARLAAFVAGLAAVFAASFGIGAAIGPEPDRPAPPAPSTTHEHTP